MKKKKIKHGWSPKTLKIKIVIASLECINIQIKVEFILRFQSDPNRDETISSFAFFSARLPLFLFKKLKKCSEEEKKMKREKLFVSASGGLRIY